MRSIASTRPVIEDLEFCIAQLAEKLRVLQIENTNIKVQLKEYIRRDVYRKKREDRFKKAKKDLKNSKALLERETNEVRELRNDLNSYYEDHKRKYFKLEIERDWLLERVFNCPHCNPEKLYAKTDTQ